MKNKFTKETKEALKKGARRGGLHSAPATHPWKKSFKPTTEKREGFEVKKI